MPFDWTTYLELARDLREQRAPSSREAAQRSAVSRAHYAAYCIAYRYCLAHGYTPRNTGEDHVGVRNHLRTPEVDLPDVADTLKELSAWRVQCDYHDIVPGDVEVKALWAQAKAQAAIVALQ